MPKEKKIPLRMCIACREMKPKKEMLRVVKNASGEISLDFSGKLTGRGAYLCNGEGCVKKLRKQRLSRSKSRKDVARQGGRFREEILYV